MLKKTTKAMNQDSSLQLALIYRLVSFLINLFINLRIISLQNFVVDSFLRINVLKELKKMVERITPIK